MTNLPRSNIATALGQPVGRAWEAYFDALERKANGEDIVLLSIGDPSFTTPTQITDALVGALRNDRTHYGPPSGELPLRKCIASMESRNTNHTIRPENVSVTLGSTGGLFSAISCIANPGENIIVPEPTYTSYVLTLGSANIDMVQVPQDGPEFSVDPDSLLAAVDNRTRAILINTPCNPTGHVVPAHVLEYLARECLKRDLWIISDEVYSLLHFDVPHMSLLRSTDCYDNIVVIDSLSKSHAMCGWRVGWTITPEHLAQDMSRHMCGINFGVSQFIQDAAEQALRSSDHDTLAMRREYRRRRDLIVERINGLDGLSCRAPEAGIFVMIHSDMHGDDLAQRLLNECAVSVFPGSAFGESCRDYVRLSLTPAKEDIERACDRIEHWWRSDAPIAVDSLPLEAARA